MNRQSVHPSQIHSSQTGPLPVLQLLHIYRRAVSMLVGCLDISRPKRMAPQLAHLYYTSSQDWRGKTQINPFYCPNSKTSE